MQVAEIAAQLRAEAAKVLVGQEAAFDLIINALLTGGHVLLEGAPGTAKTLMARTIAALVQAEFKRVQFTPDLMPSDVIGTQVFEQGSSTFRLRAGPIFTSVLLGDEINRAPAKTQSALLEAMEERQVTIDGQRMPLPDPFFVIATQNPVEYEGTYPLPEAQLDRFLFKVPVEYPAAEAEFEMLRRHHHGFDARDLAASNLRPVVDPAALVACRAEIAQVRVEDGLLNYIGQIARASRSGPDLLLGASPRASVALLRAAKTRAAMEDRNYATPDDIKVLVRPVYRHRLILRPEAEVEGLTADIAIARLLARVDVPR